MTRRFTLFCITTLSLMALIGQPAVRADEPNKAFAAFVDEYFDAYFAWKPSDATAAGLHQYDGKLEDSSKEAYLLRIEKVKALQARLAQLQQGSLSFDEKIDAEMLDHLMKAELHDLVTIGTWKRNPMGYISGPASSIDNLMKRSFAPPAERLKSVISRLKAVPAVQTSMKANLINPPREFTDLAIRMGEGSIGFFKDDVYNWAKEAAGNNTALLKEFETANAAVIKSFEESASWLKKDLLPTTKPNQFAIGKDKFAKQLLFEEMVDIPLDKLLAIGEANLKKDYDKFVATAKKIDPTKTPAEVMKLLSDKHPTEEDLIPAGKRTIEKIRKFLIDKKIVTIPSEVRPTIMETPPYARDGGFASMDTPGAYETKATEAFYYITPPEKDWDAKRKEEHLRLFNFPVLEVVTIHEAFPGHYIQFLYAKQYPTKTRKLTYSNSNVEGWAHYGEQMMLEEGYGEGDPKIQLAQLSEALLRDCRFVVGIRMHTLGMTLEDGTKYFQEKGFQEHSTAFEEARRGAYNPTYLYYTLGKLQIYKLREEYRKLKGNAFSLEEFHNTFVKQGGLPIKLIRRIMLPGDTGPSL
ncbi:DUF885 domain-containing protein [Telmatocola sphagniphila]|uniref:DUF885 domain-containing protein n=1 Tax=Telmatocola sphagniphila TaxID=1123043 RepID=A0A8E6EWX0_9BACT|nr:DUF885 domain-containing protein [Telmatocola sphagniphila]QVL31028.1 DUF885 domain-containing protein [Telmatocola sphagniphila]